MADPLTSVEIVSIVVGIAVGIFVIVVRCIYIHKARHNLPEAAGVVPAIGAGSGSGQDDPARIHVTDTVVEKMGIDALFAGSLAWITVQIAMLLLSFGGFPTVPRPWYQDSGTLWIIIIIMGVVLVNRLRNAFSSKF